MFVANLFVKPHLLLHPFPPSLSPKLSLSLSIPRFSTTPTPDPISYGPSLLKGTAPSPQNPALLLCQDSFTRVFHLSALRVPSSLCSSLESRLRGHLLNWPLIRNIARVPGDDFDPQIATLIAAGDHLPGQHDAPRASLQRRIHGRAEGDADDLTPVLYREKLARTFNSRGFVNFRNLAKISRPNRKKKKTTKKEEEQKLEERGLGKNRFAAVEVLEDEEEEQGLGNLVGEGFGRERWRGPTRLLLLDERYANRSVEELPEAIKVAPFVSPNTVSYSL